MLYGNVFIVVVISYYLTYFFMLYLYPEKKESIIQRNTELDNLRKVEIKTLEEQKQFINKKFPKKTKDFKFSDLKHFSWTYFLVYVLSYGLCFYTLSKILTAYEIIIPVYIAIPGLIILVYIVGIILKRKKLNVV